MSADISIVIPVHNSWRLTAGCLDSLRAHPPRRSIEIIVVDNASYDETPARLAERADVVVVKNARNLGFAKACNAGAARATGRVILFLNNDTYVLPGSLDRMYDSYVESPSIGVLGARLLYSDYSIQHAGMALDDSLDWRHIFVGLPAEHPLVLVKRAFQSVTGACLMIDRAFFHDVGAFDETFLNSHEDVDLCLRVRGRGREVVYDPSVVVLHYESMSAGRTLAAAKGSLLFRRKWGDQVTPDLKEKTVVFSQKMVAGYDADLRTLLERGSPYGDGVSPAFRDLQRSRALCEPHTHQRPLLERQLRRMLRVAREKTGI